MPILTKNPEIERLRIFPYLVVNFFKLLPLKTIFTTPDPIACGQVWSAGPIHFFLHWNPLQPLDIGFKIVVEVGFCTCPGTKAPKFKMINLATFISWDKSSWTMLGQEGSGWYERIFDIKVIWASCLIFSRWCVWIRPLLIIEIRVLTYLLYFSPFIYVKEIDDTWTNASNWSFFQTRSFWIAFELEAGWRPRQLYTKYAKEPQPKSLFQLIWYI